MSHDQVDERIARRSGRVCDHCSNQSRIRPIVRGIEDRFRRDVTNMMDAT